MCARAPQNREGPFAPTKPPAAPLPPSLQRVLKGTQGARRVLAGYSQGTNLALLRCRRMRRCDRRRVLLGARTRLLQSPPRGAHGARGVLTGYSRCSRGTHGVLTSARGVLTGYSRDGALREIKGTRTVAVPGVLVGDSRHCRVAQGALMGHSQTCSRVLTAYSPKSRGYSWEGTHRQHGVARADVVDRRAHRSAQPHAGRLRLQRMQ